MIRIKYNESGDTVDTIEDLKEMLQIYSDLPNKRRVLGELISALLFLEYDLPEACDAMKKLMSINTKMCNIINVSISVNNRFLSLVNNSN